MPRADLGESTGILAEEHRDSRGILRHDWFSMTGYDSASRNELTTWSLRHAAQAQLNIGVRSTLVKMGVAVASLALGTQLLRPFDDEQRLELAFQRALSTLRG